MCPSGGKNESEPEVCQQCGKPRATAGALASWMSAERCNCRYTGGRPDSDRPSRADSLSGVSSVSSVGGVGRPVMKKPGTRIKAQPRSPGSEPIALKPTPSPDAAPPAADEVPPTETPPAEPEAKPSVPDVLPASTASSSDKFTVEADSEVSPAFNALFGFPMARLRAKEEPVLERDPEQSDVPAPPKQSPRAKPDRPSVAEEPALPEVGDEPTPEVVDQPTAKEPDLAPVPEEPAVALPDESIETAPLQLEEKPEDLPVPDEALEEPSPLAEPIVEPPAPQEPAIEKLLEERSEPVGREEPAAAEFLDDLDADIEPDVDRGFDEEDDVEEEILIFHDEDPLPDLSPPAVPERRIPPGGADSSIGWNVLSGTQEIVESTIAAEMQSKSGSQPAQHAPPSEEPPSDIDTSRPDWKAPSKEWKSSFAANSKMNWPEDSGANPKTQFPDQSGVNPREQWPDESGVNPGMTDNRAATSSASGETDSKQRLDKPFGFGNLQSQKVGTTGAHTADATKPKNDWQQVEPVSPATPAKNAPPLAAPKSAPPPAQQSKQASKESSVDPSQFKEIVYQIKHDVETDQDIGGEQTATTSGAARVTARTAAEWVAVAQAQIDQPKSQFSLDAQTMFEMEQQKEIERRRQKKKKKAKTKDLKDVFRRNQIRLVVFALVVALSTWFVCVRYANSPFLMMGKGDKASQSKKSKKTKRGTRSKKNLKRKYR